MFVTTKHFCPDKSMLVMTKLKIFVATNIILSQQKFCQDKLTFVATNMCLSCQNMSFFATNICNKHMFGATNICCDKSFGHDKNILS